VADLTEALALTHLDIKERGSLLEIIRAGIDIDQAATQSIETLRRDGRIKGLVAADPQYLPPILRPSKILALALNFREDIGSVTPAVRRKLACDSAGKLYGLL
jgi:2,4-didehydro-3-deoxy-L-rhamnonate hydrolase